MAKKENIASVLAFEKKIVPSDGYFYGTNWDNRSVENSLALKEKSVRGTISNRLKPAVQKDPAKLNAEVEKANLQTVDACALGPEQDTLKMYFTLKFLGGITKPSACNNSAFQDGYKVAAQSYIDTHGFRELGRRYAINIANGRFLWRNRVGTENIEVTVNAKTNNEELSWAFNAADYSTRNFDADDQQVNNIADKIAKVLASESDFLTLEVTCYCKMGRAQEVYPSEELVLDKGKGEKSKILYEVNGIAAMHSQKIGNAIRTIDTWYPDHAELATSNGPIAIEPYGAVTNLGKAYRTPKEKKDFYSFFDVWARGETLEQEEDLHYVMAILVRGGVFGESDK